MTNLYVDLANGAVPLDVPDRALAIGAHPDDIEFGAGGTLARWAEAGTEVTMLVMTDGSKGTWDRQLSQSDLVDLRRREQKAAADTLGVGHVQSLNLVDGELEYSIQLRGAVCEAIRKARPDVLLSHDPWQRYQLHPDHRVTGLAVVDGMVAARDHLFFPEQGLEPHRPSALLLWSAETQDHWEDIATTLDRKIAALLCHSSQGQTTMGNAHDGDAERAAFADRIRTWASRAGAAVGLEAAEAFKRLTP